MAVDDPLTAVKVNEIIDAVNGIDISWVNFAGGGSPVVNGLAGDITGVTRVSAGLYRVTFPAKPSANYVVIANCSKIAGRTNGFVTINALTTTYAELYFRSSEGDANDPTVATVFIIGG